MPTTPCIKAPVRRVALGALAVMIAFPSAADAGDPAAGKVKTRACVTCHGVDGMSRVPDAPNLAGQIEMYLAQQLRAYRAGKRAHQVMSIVAGTLSDADIDDLAAWYASVRITVKLPD
ncbi:MAG: c-type cytochrome [Rhodospirillales bacterium]